MRKYQRCGSSDLRARLQELQEAHEAFMKVKDCIEKGMKITGIKKVERPKRPRIKKAQEPRLVVILVASIREVTLSYKEYMDHGQGFPVIRRIY